MSSPKKHHPVKDQNSDDSTTSPTPIPQLPDVPLSCIFKYIDMEDLYWRVPAVCEEWTNAHRQACIQRSHLSLSVGNPLLYYQKHLSYDVANLQCLPKHISKIGPNGEREPDFPGTGLSRLSLTRQSFTRPCTRNLVQQFPNISTLEVAQSIISMTAYNALIYLIEQWSTTLTTLRIWTWWEIFSDEEKNKSEQALPTAILTRLYQVINNCSKLEHLTFFEAANGNGPYYYLDDTPNLTILSRLKTFQYSTHNIATRILHSLANYGQDNDALQSIDVGNTMVFNLAEGIQLTAQFMRRFHSFNIEVKSEERFQFLLQAVNLRKLRIKFTYRHRQINILQTLERLQALNHLEELHLLPVSFKPVSDAFANISPENLPRFPSLRRLYIQFRAESHEVFHSDHLTTIFPVIEKLELVYLIRECRICKHVDGYDNSRDLHRKCDQKIMDNWKQCSTLKYICFFPLNKYNPISRFVNEQVIDYLKQLKVVEYWKE